VNESGERQVSCSIRGMNDLLLRQLRGAAAQTFESSPVLFAYLFGSMATGLDHAGSDVDVAVFLEPLVAPDRVVELSLELARHLSEETGRADVDVLVLNEAPLLILGRVVRERVVLYSRDEPARVRFESHTFREFFDFDFHARQLDQKFLRDTAGGRR